MLLAIVQKMHRRGSNKIPCPIGSHFVLTFFCCLQPLDDVFHSVVKAKADREEHCLITFESSDFKFATVHAYVHNLVSLCCSAIYYVTYTLFNHHFIVIFNNFNADN